ncbi:MAG: FliI/YscN family ATPase [Halochromatium sp.]|uniref:FliI/YscN family ATPase n=1 Tax=Halochromatium sp. TaxID=2049430 RepID=UPI00397BDA86
MTTPDVDMDTDRAQSDPLLAALERVDSVRRVGRVTEAYGTLIRATGIAARIGETCELRHPATGDSLLAEVVGVSDRHTLLTPLGGIQGLSADMEVLSRGERSQVPAGEALLGRVLAADGSPMDGKPAPQGCSRVPLYAEAPNPLHRAPVDRVLPTGIRSIDATVTVGSGQRLGMFAAAGGGKSTLLGMLARGTQADCNVIVLVGERGREVREFIQDNLGAEGLARSVVVVATSDRPAMERARAALVGTAIAEHFRDLGRDVVLMMDSVTRYARALREMGLAVGEPPARRGYPPSVFSTLPQLFERAGNNAHGSITGFYTVLLEDEDTANDPIGEEVRSILDGHIVLSRRLAEEAHYPAIDVLASTSRVMPRVASTEHQEAAQQLRRDLAKYREIELLIQVGEYQHGSDPAADRAVARIDNIRSLLKQGTDELTSFASTMNGLQEVVA